MKERAKDNERTKRGSKLQLELLSSWLNLAEMLVEIMLTRANSDVSADLPWPLSSLIFFPVRLNLPRQTPPFVSTFTLFGLPVTTNNCTHHGMPP